MDVGKRGRIGTKYAIFPNVAHVLMLGERHLDVSIAISMETVSALRNIELRFNDKT